MATKEDIRSQAMGLPERDRGELARDLLLSLEGGQPEPVPGSIDQAWAPELTRRLDDVLSGRETAVSSDEAHAQVREALRNVKRK